MFKCVCRDACAWSPTHPCVHVRLYVCVGVSAVEVGDIFQSLLCRFLIVLRSCLPLCTINSIICTQPSQPASPWAIVFPSGVSALDAVCHPCPPTVGTGLARPRWDVLAFGHCPLQEARGRCEGGLRGCGGEVASTAGEGQSTGPCAQPVLQFRGEEG